MNTFRLSNKKVHKDSRSTIENLHNEKMDKIFNSYKTLDNKKEKLKFLKEKLEVLEQNRNSTTSKTIISTREEIKTLEESINYIEKDCELSDYIDKAWEFLINFNDNDDNITITDNKTIDETNESNKNNESNESDESNKNNQSNQSTKSNESNESNENKDTKKNGNILNFINKTGKTNKGEEYKRYYNKCFLNINYVQDNSDVNICKNCKSNSFEIDSKNGLIICNICGVCNIYYENTSANLNYSDISHVETVSQPFSYQRKNHFREWLNQLQGKEVTVIPESVITLVLLEIKKERIENADEITAERVKKYLKKLKLNKYYEHIPNLISKLTNKPPLCITSEFEEVLLDLFDKIQQPFTKYCPSNRKNFLSYSYTLHKFCQLLNKTEFLIYFPLLKSREKLFEQEKIWKGICNDLNWKFIPSI